VDDSFHVAFAAATAAKTCRQGTDEQKQQLLPGMADNSLAGCWALTEPSNGSDASALTCTATKVKRCFLLMCERGCMEGGGQVFD
jgi:acyl-CoA oxidase